jgi:hypothetical protein
MTDRPAPEAPGDVPATAAATVPLGELLGHVLEGEPALAGEVDEIFRRADALRRRRTRLLLVAGATIAALIVVAGYLLTTTLLPARGASRARPAGPATLASVVPVPSAIADPVLALVAPMIDGDHRRIVPRPPARGFGWRQYSVLTADGHSHGTVQFAIFARPGGLCLPRRDGKDGCARADRAGGGIDYVPYGDGTDPDWQVNEVIARRTADGRTIAVMATGERDVADPADAAPPLSANQVERLATDERLLGAFGSSEGCDGPSANACPIFKVPVPDGDSD